MAGFLIFGLIFGGIGALVMALGLRERSILAELKTSGVEAEATVTNVQRKVTKDTDGNRDVDWIAHYTFTTAEGIRQNGQKRYETKRGVPAVGDILAITYLPDKPDRNRLSSAVQTETGLVYLLIGGVFFIVGVGVVIVGLTAEIS